MYELSSWKGTYFIANILGMMLLNKFIKLQNVVIMLFQNYGWMLQKWSKKISVKFEKKGNTNHNVS